MAQIPVPRSTAEAQEGRQSCPWPRYQQGSAVPSRGSAPPSSRPCHHWQTQWLYSKARRGETRREQNQNKSEHVSLCAPGPAPGPSSCHPRWNVPPNSSLARCVLLPALPLIVCSDCAFPTLQIMARDHPWLRAGSVAPPALCASAGLGAAATEGSRRGEVGAA